MRVLLSLATGDEYALALDLLLRSIKRLHTDLMILVGCVGWSDELLGDFRSRYSAYEFMPRDLLKSGSGQRQCVISLKANLIADVLATLPSNATMLYTDADHLVLKDLGPWFEEMSHYDLALRYRPEWRGNLRHEYLAGVIGVRNNTHGRLAIKTWSDLVATRPLDQWVDQETLPGVFEFCASNSVRVWQMGQEVLSADSGNMDAYLWARRSWELVLEERMAENLEILMSLEKTGRMPSQ